MIWEQFTHLGNFPPELKARFNSFLTSEFDDSLSVEMQLRSIIKWCQDNFKTVDTLIDFINGISNWLKQFENNFDTKLEDSIISVLSEWQASGKLDVVISEALQWQLDDYIATNEQDKLSLTAQLQQTEKVANVKALGAKGDGVTDDLLAIQNAIDYGVANGLKVFFPQGIYYVSDSIRITADNVVLESDNATIDIKNNHMLLGAIVVEGQQGNTFTLSHSLYKGQSTLPVSPNTEYVTIATNELYNNERAYYYKGEMVKVNGNILEESLQDNYQHTGYNLLIHEINPVKNVVIDGFHFTKNLSSSPSNKSNGVYLKYTVNVTVKNCSGEHFDDSVIKLDQGYKANIENIRSENGNKETGLCYGISVVNSSRHIYINNVNGYKLRHVIAIGSSGEGMVRFAEIENVFDTHTYITSFDIHEIAENIHYKNCIGEWYSAGGRYNTFENCKFLPPINSGNYTNGMLLRFGSMSDYTKFIGCQFQGVVGWNNQNKTKTYGVEIRDCLIEIMDDKDIQIFSTGSPFHNIEMVFRNNIVISNVTPRVDVSNLENSKSVIELRLGENSVIQGNIFKNLNTPIDIIYSNIKVKGNKFINCFNYVVKIRTISGMNNPVNTIVESNEFDSKGVTFNCGTNRYCIQLDSLVDGKQINNSRIINNTIETNQLNAGGIILNGNIRNASSRNMDNIVTGNIVKNTKSFGVLIGHDYQNAIITNNIVMGNTSGQIVANSDSKIINQNNITTDIV